MMTRKTMAMLTINGPGKMTDKERDAISLWLMQQATDLRRDGEKYTDARFVARHY